MYNRLNALSVFVTLFSLLCAQECKIELNDEEGHRCYPLNGHLLCHSCHLKNIQGCTSSIATSSY